MALVSVIIPVYNRLEYIGEAIESVFNQTYKNYEILVVDDGSTFDIQKVLTPYIDRIRYVRQEHQGLPAARNTGIRHSLGKYIAFLDDDDIFEPRKLEIQRSILEKYPEIGFVYSDCYEFDTNNIADTHLGLAIGRDQPEDEFTRLFFMTPHVRVPTVLIRRQCFENVGGFDESLSQHEDGDMFLRVALSWSVRFSHYPSAKVRIHPGRMSQNRAMVYKCILKSSYKILQLYPEFASILQENANKKLAELHYALSQIYIGEHKYQEARDELACYFSLSKSIERKAWVYKFVLHTPWPDFIFRLLRSMKGSIDSS